jgi:hypothetical protein
MISLCRHLSELLIARDAQKQTPHVVGATSLRNFLCFSHRRAEEGLTSHKSFHTNTPSPDWSTYFPFGITIILFFIELRRNFISPQRPLVALAVRALMSPPNKQWYCLIATPCCMNSSSIRLCWHVRLILAEVTVPKHNHSDSTIQKQDVLTSGGMRSWFTCLLCKRRWTKYSKPPTARICPTRFRLYA